MERRVIQQASIVTRQNIIMIIKQTGVLCAIKFDSGQYTSAHFCINYRYWTNKANLKELIAATGQVIKSWIFLALMT